MGGREKTPDLRRLVPRTPPEGLERWALQTCPEELERCGLVYEAEWAEEFDLTSRMLDELYKPKKVKVVRVRCSCCGEEVVLNWGPDRAHGYGFIHPDDEEGDWSRTVTAAGETTRCPICGQKVLVNKRAAVKDFFVAAECCVMSAQLVGEENLLALTVWTVQRRVYKSGNARLEIIPAEAYVFGSSECVQLIGWRNAYSGNAGHFVTYSPVWRQSKRWNGCWGREEAVFGLTPELVAASCLPHCKLDVYMARRPGANHYPVLYLRLYQKHANVESLLLHGLPRVLDGLIDDAANGAGDPASPKTIELPKINWAESRPAQMLRLTKEELRMAQGQDWGVLFWNLFLRAKAGGELLTAEDIQNAFCLGDEHVGQLVGRGPVAKSIRYLLGQCELLGVEGEGEDPPPYGIPDVQILTDYWTMAANLGRNLNDPSVRFPRDLIAAHDSMAGLMQERLEHDLASQFRVRRKQLKRYSFAADGLLIRPAASQEELTREGDALRHCVSTYGKKHASGKSAIFFIRRRGRPKEPYYTLELDEAALTVIQNRGMCNCPRTPEVQAFEDLWLDWLRAGSKRDKQGRPVAPAQEKRKRGAA